MTVILTKRPFIEYSFTTLCLLIIILIWGNYIQYKNPQKEKIMKNINSWIVKHHVAKVNVLKSPAKDADSEF